MSDAVSARTMFMAAGQGAVSLSKGSVLGIMQLKADLLLLAGDLGKRGGLHEPLQETVEKVIIPSIRLNFAAEGRPQMWEPVDVLNYYRVSRGAGGAPILQPSGMMAKTAIAKARFTVRGNKIEYGNWPEGSAHKASRHGYIHDMGGESPFGKIPARPFAILQQQDIESVTKVFADWVQRRAGKRLKVHYGGF